MVEEQYVETSSGLDVKKFWTKEGYEGMVVAIEAVERFDNSASAVKDLIDNPDLNHYQTEIAVAYMTGLNLGLVLNKPKSVFDEFFGALP